MNASKKYHKNWESINEERLILLFESIWAISKESIRISVSVLNLIAFVFYRSAALAVAILNAVFLAKPIVKIEREESWIYRQIK